ncbi:hypothetical protein AAW51_2524 [Caldimonas brevitalea]|uniref:Uncharacterized protein n=2 Tax=Caldimonas brevitalea TaxID=413882 RepID=A0A0G3BRQ1_9BURK|nr:hypothetical protein AAW51_2524 [Caldimonas brevitalea]
MRTLHTGQESIQITKRLLPYGSGNQELDVLRTQGEAARRSAAVHALKGHYTQQDMSHIRNKTDVTPEEQALLEIKNSARLAVSFGAGNCGEQADVALAVLSNMPRDVPIHKVQFEFMDHALLIAGDLNSKKNQVVIDPWPTHATSHMMRDGLADGLPYKRLYTLNPADPSLFSQAQLEAFRQQGVPPARVDEHNQGRPVGSELVQSLLDSNTVHCQPHSLKNPGLTYESAGQDGEVKKKSHEVPQSQHQQYQASMAAGATRKPALMRPEDDDA